MRVYRKGPGAEASEPEVSYSQASTEGEAEAKNELLAWIRSLSAIEFEYYIADFFRKLNYNAKVVGSHGSGDGGIDLVIVKDGLRHFVQCKRYINSHVGEPMVRDFYGAIVDSLGEREKGYLVTTHYYSEAAKKFATTRPIELIDADKLVKYIMTVEHYSGKIKKPTVPEEAYVCPRCKIGSIVRKYSTKNSRYFYGCSRFPRCRYAMSEQKFHNF